MRYSPVHEWQPLMELLLQDVEPYLDRPFAIFGHSMGALVGIKLAHELRRRHGVDPVWMGLSACIAPAMRERETKWLDCPHSELMDEIVSLNGTAPDILGNDEFMALIAPVLRADFHLCGTYARGDGPPLACPVLVLGGSQDDEVMESPDNLSAWAQETSGAFDLQLLDADHFFINSHQDDVIARVEASLERHVHTSSRGTIVGHTARAGAWPGAR